MRLYVCIPQEISRQVWTWYACYYYYYSKQFDSPKPDKYAGIKSEIRRIYDESKGRYGYLICAARDSGNIYEYPYLIVQQLGIIS